MCGGLQIKTPELNEKDDLDIEDEWYYEDEDYGGGLRGKIQNLVSRSDQMVLEAVLLGFLYVLGIWVNAEIVFRIVGVPSSTMDWDYYHLWHL